MESENSNCNYIRDVLRNATPCIGVRQCSFCWNSKDCPKFHHRDLNSAENMMDIYLSLAQSGERPEVFARCHTERGDVHGIDRNQISPFSGSLEVKL